MLRSMKETLQILDALSSLPSGGAALATLVKVEGSSYRRPGARLLLTADGQRTGSISGGCLEDDVVGHAREVLASGVAKAVTYDTTTENDLVWGVGLGCHGVVHVLVEKLPRQPAWAAVLRENLRRRAPTELAVVWRSPDPDLLGTQLAAELAAPPAPAFSSGRARPSSAGFQPAPILGGQAGMPALPPKPLSAPNTEVFRQVIAPPVPLVIFGAGNDAQPLVRSAKELGWHVTVVDPRPAFATAARFPAADSVVIARPEEAPARVVLGSDTLVVVMTHHYAHDVPLLRHLLTRPLAYLGLLGPRKRSAKILSDLAADGLALTPAMRARLHAPVGLDLGADTPEEVALAILAEMQSTLTGRDGRPLRERTLPIHTG
jgi:xanthine/CO dehydrogenase XdhC/CoxF family maturation factor